MKKIIFILISMLIPCAIIAGNYSVEVGSTETIYCTANAPAGGWIDVCNWSLVDAGDAVYVKINNHSREQYATITGLQAKANIRVEVTYSYSVPTNNGTYIVGHASYYDNITVTGGVQPTSVSLDQSNVTLRVGQTTTLTASLSPYNANTTYSWGFVMGFGNPTNFTLTPSGNTATIKADAAGSAKVLVTTANGKTAFCDITAVTVDATDITIIISDNTLIPNGGDTYTLEVGKTASLIASLTPSESTSTVSWSTSSSSIVSVSPIGKTATIKAKSAGTATITVKTSNGLSSSIEVNASNAVPATSISLQDMTLTVGEIQAVSYSLTPYNATSTISSWKSSNTSVATISNYTGKVTAKAEGTTTITATTNNGITGTCVVTVSNSGTSNLPTSISLYPTSMNLTVGDYQYINETFYPEGTSADITWSSSKTSVATVNSVGKVTAVGVGSATITAKTSNGKTATCSVTVTEASSVIQPTSISLSPTSISLEVGGTKSLTYTLSPSNATTSVTWNSSNPSVATVSTSGKVTAVSVGSATITARTSNGKTATCDVTVTEAQQDNPLVSGTCGTNLNWELKDSVLIISGTGDMNDFSYPIGTYREMRNNSYQDETIAPWYSYISSIKSVKIYKGCTSIGKFAFADCSSLTSVVISNSVTRIGEYAFLRCSSLTSEIIPNSVMSIGSSAFYGCSGLISVTIPNSVTSIGGRAFENCSKLISVIIPNSVTIIGDYAFYGCGRLGHLTCLAIEPPTISSLTFNKINLTNSKLYVLEESVSVYKKAKYWKEFTKILSIDAADFAEYEAYQSILITTCEAMAEDVDSDDVLSLIESTISAILSITYDGGKSLEDNKAVLDAIVEQLRYGISAEQDIENVYSSDAAMKIIRGNQILILRDGKTYNTMGVQVR